MNGETLQIIKSGLIFALAGATAGGGYLTWIEYIPAIAGLIGTVCASTLSLALAYKAFTDTWENKKTKLAEREDIKYRQEHDLPCRRCTDK